MSDLPEPKDDGLLITQDVGPWSQKKHYYLQRYIDAFTTAMKHKAWESLHYIDLFAGSGIEQIKDSDKLEWGSPMIAAMTRYSFKKLHLCEKNPEKYNALKSRVLSKKPDSQILLGDGNEKIHEIVSDIPLDSLSLAFLDPYGLHLEFETLEILSKRRADLIIFFPDYLDAIRNKDKYYFKNPESNLDKFLGADSNWREKLKDIPAQREAETLRELYREQLAKKLGYRFFDFERITMKNRSLYCLIFCSKSNLAVNIWRRLVLKESDGQRRFDYS